ncbi:YqaJ viral recombinase family protein [Streptomyces sp. B1866]|uniref:YqaJ viral recombinase family nuclease n=1 Tax=Streptomyces sp. B1866 TaxID=3075431 RepID=UPI00288F7E63|nr:YqaJ viral recombinase family protein [Streptomyces sp. B1866]MDT3395570.1 YqaJ viral recombinase family protein [Streptomyces sp. B1866]
MTAAPERPAAVTPAGVVVTAPGVERERWLAARRTGVGGSDVAAVLGMDEHVSPLEVYLDKVGDLPGRPRSPELDEAAFWGLAHEPVIARVFAERTGLRVVDGPGMLAHVDRRWMLATVDRLVAEPSAFLPASLLEIKTRSAYQLDEWLLGVPDGPALQTHWYLAVTGYGHAHVAALLGGNRLIVHRVERDEGLIEHLVQIVGAFWQRVVDRAPPPVDGSAATADLLAHLYDVAPGSVTVADPREVLPLLERHRELKQRQERTADALREVDNRLKAIAGRAEVVTVRGDVAYTWKQNGPFSPKRFSAACPGLAAQYTRPADVLDTARLAAEHPARYRAFRALFSASSVGPTLGLIDIRSGPTSDGEPATGLSARRPPLAASLSVTCRSAARVARTPDGANFDVGVEPVSVATNRARRLLVPAAKESAR